MVYPLWSLLRTSGPWEQRTAKVQPAWICRLTGSVATWLQIAIDPSVLVKINREAQPTNRETFVPRVLEKTMPLSLPPAWRVN